MNWTIPRRKKPSRKKPVSVLVLIRHRSILEEILNCEVVLNRRLSGGRGLSTEATGPRRPWAAKKMLRRSCLNLNSVPKQHKFDQQRSSPCVSKNKIPYTKLGIRTPFLFIFIPDFSLRMPTLSTQYCVHLYKVMPHRTIAAFMHISKTASQSYRLK